MPLSDFLDKFNPSEKSSPAGEALLCLVIGDKKVKSGIWVPPDKNTAGQSPEVLSFGSTENWSGEDAEELIVVADTSVASAVSKLPEVSSSQPSKMVLGLPDSWIEKSSIKPQKLTLLEKVCKKLLLKPQGFVVTAEAIAYLLKKDEGGLPSTILVSLEESEIGVSLIVGGKFLGTKVVGRSDNLALDLEEGLLRFDYKEALPSRILLFDGGEDLEETKQSLIVYPWVDPEGEKKLRFLQLPKVESAPQTFEVSAVIMACSREFTSTEKKNKELIPKAAEESDETNNEKETELSTLGVEEKEFTEELIMVKDFGFIQGKDIAKTRQVSESLPQKTEPSKDEGKNEEDFTNREEQVVIKKSRFNLGKMFGFFGQIIGRVFSSFSSLKFPFVPKKVFLLPFILITIFGLALFGMLSIVKAEVVVLAKPQKIQKEFNFTVSSESTQVDKEKMILPAQQLTLEVSAEKTSSVNGKKIVGEKASGEVIIYNRSDQTKTLSKNSYIISSSGLRFVLTEEVTIASKSADLSEGVDKWGEAKVVVVAEEIGTQYNLSASSTLTVGNVSSAILLVKNNADFSGGSSREIQAVSKQDRDTLAQALTAELKQKAEEQAREKIGSQDQLLSDSLTLESRTDSFDHKEGDEADSLTLETKAQFLALYFRQDDFSILVEEVVSSLVSDGYEKSPARSEKTFELKDQQAKLYLAKVNYEYLPLIDSEKITKDLRLKSFAKAEEYLNNFNQFAGIEIFIKPKYFSFLKRLPLNSKNINLVAEPI